MLALIEICKKGQLSKIYPYKDTSNEDKSHQPYVIPFIRNLVMKDAVLQKVKIPSMYSPYQAKNTTLPSPI